MENIKEILIKNLCDEKAKQNNTIDLNAYAIGLSEMFDAVGLSNRLSLPSTEERKKAEEIVDIQNEFYKKFTSHNHPNVRAIFREVPSTVFKWLREKLSQQAEAKDKEIEKLKWDLDCKQLTLTRKYLIATICNPNYQP
jgi:hypothetical protein